MKKSESIKELATALCKAQSKLDGAVKDSSNPFFKSKYADLESIFAAIRGPFLENGLSISQTTDFSLEGGICVETMLMHTSGEWICGSLPVRALKDEPQAIGSAISYSRRYALAAICGVYSKDDDGEAAYGRTASNTNAPLTTYSPGPISTLVDEKCPACKGKMFVSKFDPNKLYCPACAKAKKAKPQDDLPF